MKKCTKCGVEKPLSEFYKNKSKKDGLQTRCKICDVLKTRKKYQKDPELSAKKRFIRKLKQEYNLSLEEYNTIKTIQNGACAICKSPLQTGMSVHVDHCHDSGKVRGILCRWCNLGLGHFKDSLISLKSALLYLEKYNWQTGQKRPRFLYYYMYATKKPNQSKKEKLWQLMLFCRPPAVNVG